MGISKGETEKNNKYKIHFLRLKSLNTSQITILLAATIIMMVILSSYTLRSYAQEKDISNIQLSEYFDSKGAYKISYPINATVMERVNNPPHEKSLLEIRGPEWIFVIVVNEARSDNLDWIIDDFIKMQSYRGISWEKENKSLTVAGQAANMLSTERYPSKVNVIFLLINNLEYIFTIEAPMFKFDQYANLFFTILKSFELTK